MQRTSSLTQTAYALLSDLTHISRRLPAPRFLSSEVPTETLAVSPDWREPERLTEALVLVDAIPRLHGEGRRPRSRRQNRSRVVAAI